MVYCFEKVRFGGIGVEKTAFARDKEPPLSSLPMFYMRFVLKEVSNSSTFLIN